MNIQVALTGIAILGVLIFLGVCFLRYEIIGLRHKLITANKRIWALEGRYTELHRLIGIEVQENEVEYKTQPELETVASTEGEIVPNWASW